MAQKNLHLPSLRLSLSRGIRPSPARDWRILLALALLSFAAVAGWSVWAFEVVVSGGTIGTPPPAHKISVSQTSLETARQLFVKRAIEDAKYADGTYHFADPSQGAPGAGPSTASQQSAP